METNFAVLQLNPIVGDIVKNTDKLIKNYNTARANGAELVVAGECVITGYPIEDLVLRPSFMEAVEEQMRRVIKHVNDTNGPSLIFGTPARIKTGFMGANSLFNCAVLAYSENDFAETFTQTRHLQNTIFNDENGKFSIHAKYELPNYGVFDEKRVFSSDIQKVQVAPWKQYDLGIMICEDTWYPTVSAELTRQGADMLISINGSPYERGKRVTRRKVVAKRIKETGLPMLYVNLVGGQDELVFDGGSFCFDGNKLFEFGEFKEVEAHFSTEIILQEFRDLPQLGNRITPTKYPLVWDEYVDIDDGGIGQDYRAATLATRDYLRKQGFDKVVLGYSGGVDSGLVAAIACDAIGAENVTLVSLPSGFSSEHSKSDAREGAKRLGTEFRTIHIEGVVNALRDAYGSTAYAGYNYHGYEPEHDLTDIVPKKLTGTADENIQARARGSILMAISNQENKMVFTTGNKSEGAVGYCTIDGGDTTGGFNPIKDFYKTNVWGACRWRNSLTPEQVSYFGFYGKGNIDVVPEEIIVKPPSAELRPDQQDSDSLPPYETLDDILEKMVELDLSNAKIIESGHSEENVLRVRKLLNGAEFKRRKTAPGVKVTKKLFGLERRYPIINKWGE